MPQLGDIGLSSNWESRSIQIFIPLIYYRISIGKSCSIYEFHTLHGEVVDAVDSEEPSVDLFSTPLDSLPTTQVEAEDAQQQGDVRLKSRTHTNGGG